MNPHVHLKEELKVISELGGDPLVGIWLPQPTLHPDVKETKGFCGTDHEGHPLRFAEWKTPAGTLRMVVKETDDWQNRDRHTHLENRMLEDGLRDEDDWDLYLFDDWNCSRFVEAPVKTIQDVEALKYLLCFPGDDDLAKWREGERVTETVCSHLPQTL